MLEELYNDRVLAAVQNLKPIAQRLNLSMAQLALAWVLRDSRVSSAIVGASRPEQIEDNAAASGFHLSDDVLREIDEILAPVLPQPTAR
jgi:aryl-alcohol dehydrogenase-like predicted oxidoreductase